MGWEGGGTVETVWGAVDPDPSAYLHFLVGVQSQVILKRPSQLTPIIVPHFY